MDTELLLDVRDLFPFGIAVQDEVDKGRLIICLENRSVNKFRSQKFPCAHSRYASAQQLVTNNNVKSMAMTEDSKFDHPVKP